MKPTTSKAIQDHIMISPKLITDMESCLRQLTTTTNRANYVNDLIKANHRKQQSIQRRYHAISNEHMSELGQTIKPLMEEQGRVCDENELLMNMVNDMEFRLKACETLITSVGHQFTAQLREKPTNNTLGIYRQEINYKNKKYYGTLFLCKVSTYHSDSVMQISCQNQISQRAK